MNILYINHYAGSPEMGMEFRPYYLSKEWVKMGHNVTIIAGDYSHLRGRNPVVNKDFESEVIDGIEYVWVKTGKYEGNGIARALTMERFVRKLFVHAGMIAKRWNPDVIITSSTYPLDTYAGQRIRRFSGAKLVHEVHDMWPITLIEIGGMKKTNPFVMLMQMGENSFCKRSDEIVSLLPAAKSYFIKHGMADEKFHVVMNGVVLEEWQNSNSLPIEHQRLLDNLHEDQCFVVCFFGSVNVSYAIDYLIEAHKELNDKRIAIVIVGEGNQKEELKKTAGNGVYFLPRISKTSIPTLLKNVDCCYVGALRNDMFRFGICMNKLFDSMMSGKPILYAVDAPNNLVNDFSCGVSVEAENVDAIKNGLLKLVNMDKKEQERIGQNGRTAILKFFTYDKLAEQFLKEISR